MSKRDKDFDLGIGLLCIFSIAAWIGVGINSITNLFNDSDDRDIMIEYYNELHPYNQEDVHREILKSYINQMDAPLDSLERFMLDLMWNQEIPSRTVGSLIGEILKPNKDLMSYPFTDLQYSYNFSVATSEDGMIRTYVWHNGSLDYHNGYKYKFLVSDNDYISDINFDYIFHEGKRSNDEFQDFRIHNFHLNSKKYYLLQIFHKQPSEHEKRATISLYSIDEGGQLIKERLIKTPSGVVSHISITFQMDGEDGDDGWLFDYHDYNQTLYVPIVDEGENRYISSDYELYKWDGQYFSPIGVDKHWRHEEESEEESEE